MLKNYVMIARNLSSIKLKSVEKELTAFLTVENFISLDHGNWLLKTDMSTDAISKKLQEVINFSEDLILIELAEDYYVRIKDAKIENWFSSKFDDPSSKE